MYFLYISLLPIFFFLIPFADDPRNYTRSTGVFFILLFIFLKIRRTINNSNKNQSFVSKNIHFLGISFFETKTWVVYGLVILGLHLWILSELHFRSLFLTENDFVSMSEVLNQTLKGHFFKDHFHGDMENGNYLAHHFSPTLLVLSPFLWLSETRMGYAYGLIFISLGCSYIFFLHIQHFSQKYKIFLFTFFLLNLYNYRIFTAYHFEVLFLLFFLIWILCFKKKYLISEIIFFIICLGVKEDIAIYLVFFSFYFLFKKENARFLGYFSFCLLYYFFIIPYFQNQLDQSTKENWLHIWGKYGQSIPEIILYIIKNPNLILMEIWNRKSVAIDLLGSFSFIPLGSLIIYSSLISILGLHILSTRIWHNSFYHYYSYSILPTLWVGVLDIFSKKPKISIQLLALFFGIGLYFSGNDKHFPLTFQQITEPNFSSIQFAIAKIPKGSSVQVSFQIGALLSRSNPVYPIQAGFVTKDYLLFVPSPLLSKEETNRIEKNLKKQEEDGKIILVFSQNLVKMYKKKDSV
jgi:uncharacterized membrane protein